MKLENRDRHSLPVTRFVRVPEFSGAVVRDAQRVHHVCSIRRQVSWPSASQLKQARDHKFRPCCELVEAWKTFARCDDQRDIVRIRNQPFPQRGHAVVIREARDKLFLFLRFEQWTKYRWINIGRSWRRKYLLSPEIQIAPTNQYDSAVHRLFQVTANIYDATSTNLYPTVFRPLFETRSNGVFLAGFTNDNRVTTLGEWLVSNPCNHVPLVIAARKGFPKLQRVREHGLELLVARRLQFTRLAHKPAAEWNKRDVHVEHLEPLRH